MCCSIAIILLASPTSQVLAMSGLLFCSLDYGHVYAGMNNSVKISETLLRWFYCEFGGHEPESPYATEKIMPPSLSTCFP